MSTTIVFVPQTVWLCPRPLARCPSRFPLIPLLPHQPACKPLPSEVWSRVFECLFALYDANAALSTQISVSQKLNLLLVSRNLNVSVGAL